MANRLDVETVEYFKALAEEPAVPHQTLINPYLRDCAAYKRRLSMKWKAAEVSNQPLQPTPHGGR